jgi:superfamily II RNA helicase
MASFYSCDVSKDPEHIVAQPAIDFSFPLDPFQKHAIAVIDQEHNVLVCAKTGSGKTLVAEYAIANCLKKGQRVFYTTPIKSLSNQKFHDLKQAYPTMGQVGIMTGDIKFCPDAQIVIMTTEILRNLLYKQGTTTEHLGITSSLSLKGLGAVIFDECHYINDKDRGKIWEETMILLPQSVQLILLSATLDSPNLFADWLGMVRQRPCALIQTQYRVVPLTHSVLLGKEPQVLMDAKEVFNPVVYREWIQSRKKQVKDSEEYRRKVISAREGGQEGRIEGKTTVASFVHQLNETIQMLEEKELLPALVFVFSRKDCERFAELVVHQLLDSSDSALADRVFDFHLRHHKKSLETLPQYHALKRQIIRGIAFHHSGLIPILKEALEILFSKGLIKLLFCTETFAVGINMPTKSVLFLNLMKYDSSFQGMRMLRTDEYIQMAGRAGRRGKDKVGYVFYLPEREPPGLEDMQKMMKGGRTRLQSRMEFGYDFLLKTLHTTSLKWIDLVQKSYWYRQWEQQQQSTKIELHCLKTKLDAISLTDEQRIELDARKELETTIKATQNAKRREAQKLLEQWKNKHIGPRWANAETQYAQWVKLNTEYRELFALYQENENYTLSIERKLRFLQEIGYISGDTQLLTQHGVVATEFNEGHPVLCTNLAFDHSLDELTAEEIVSVLSVFIMDSEKDESQPHLEELNITEGMASAVRKIQSIAKQMGDLEEKCVGPSEFWRLSTEWIEPIWRWLQGDSATQICVDYGLFEGNFVRAVLRLSNLIDEWTGVATMLENITMLDKLRDIRTTLVRDFLVPDSLYLRL